MKIMGESVQRLNGKCIRDGMSIPKTEPLFDDLPTMMAEGDHLNT